MERMSRSPKLGTSICCIYITFAWFSPSFEAFPFSTADFSYAVVLLSSLSLPAERRGLGIGDWGRIGENPLDASRHVEIHTRRDRAFPALNLSRIIKPNERKKHKAPPKRIQRT